MPPHERKLFLHVCTACGKERYTEEKTTKTGLCFRCMLLRRNARPLHFSPGALYADETLARFWSKVEKDTACACHPWEERCWRWTAHINPKTGYGFFSTRGIDNERYNTSAHRFAYQVEHGKLLEEFWALHRPPCILKTCVRHIYAGTPLENEDDKRIMQHTLRGEDSPSAIVTEAEVLAIRADFAASMRIYLLVAKYGRTKEHIRKIVCRGIWKHLP